MGATCRSAISQLFLSLLRSLFEQKQQCSHGEGVLMSLLLCRLGGKQLLFSSAYSGVSCRHCIEKHTSIFPKIHKMLLLSFSLTASHQLIWTHLLHLVFSLASFSPHLFQFGFLPTLSWMFSPFFVYCLQLSIFALATYLFSVNIPSLSSRNFAVFFYCFTFFCSRWFLPIFPTFPSC